MVFRSERICGVQSDLLLSTYSFDRAQCEVLAEGITREFVKREEDLKGDKGNLKLEKEKEKKQRQSQKRLKKERDLTEKEKERRLVKRFLGLMPMMPLVAWICLKF